MFQSLLKTRLEKITWLLVVCLGFLGAGILIDKSYKEWQTSPIATSITTHPIEKLNFPIVTLCPPRDSNTTLYHDLVKAGNRTLTDTERVSLRESARTIIMEASQRDYIKKMVAISNLGNMDQVYQGHYSLPKPYKTPPLTEKIH